MSSSRADMYATIPAETVRRIAMRATRATARAIELEVMVQTIEDLVKMGGSCNEIADVIASMRGNMTTLDGP